MMASSVRWTMSLVLSWVRPMSSEIFFTISFLVTLVVSTKGSARSERRLAQLYWWLGVVSSQKGRNPGLVREISDREGRANPGPRPRSVVGPGPGEAHGAVGNGPP